MHTVDCAGVSKYFEEGTHRVDVLRDLELRVAAREKVAILGASGSGKSTLLHILGGLETINAGRIAVCNETLADLNEEALCRLRNRAIGFIYQAHHLLPEFSALENVSMPLLIRGLSRDEAFDAARQLLTRAQLAARCAHKPEALSGGERQRVAVCRALITRPQLILADEPTGSLDKQTAERTMDILLEINELATLVMVTHDAAMAARLDRSYQLENGRLRPTS